MDDDSYTIRFICGDWGPRDHPAWPDDFPMPPSCHLDNGHDGPHAGSFGTEWAS